MYTLVGSRAMRMHWTDARNVLTADWDYFTPCTVGTEPSLPPGHRNDIFEHPMLHTYPMGPVAAPDELYTIKISHMFWVPNDQPAIWNKHMGDAIFMQRKGCQFIRPLYDILFPIWKQHYATKKTNTKMSKAEFFNDAVVRKYDHDSLHRSVAYQQWRGKQQPWYELILKPGATVDCSWDLFSALTGDAKLQMIREEIYVTALERLIIPADYSYSPRLAYQFALRKCVTSLFKNEWALWIALHLDELRKPDVDYVERHKANHHLLLPNGV